MRFGLCASLLAGLCLAAPTFNAHPGLPRAVPPAFAQDQLPGLPQAMQKLGAQDFAGAEEILTALTAREPENARAWSMLGYARHAQKKYDLAIEAYVKAMEFPAVAPTAMYNAGLACALKGDPDQAFDWLRKAKATGKMDMTQIAFDDDSISLREDPRWASLFPTPEDFARPFVENVRVIREWDGEVAGDQFGWIARNIGDVDGDGVADVVTSAPTNAEGGEKAGKVYVYAGGSGELLWTATGAAGDQLGLGVEAAGDVNADGTPDVIAGAPGGDHARVYSGLDGGVLLDLRGTQTGEFFGRKVSDAGDFDRDGHDDVIVGAPQNDEAGEDAGKAYVFSGRDGTVLHTWLGEAAGDAYGSAGAGYVSGETALVVVGAPNAGPDHGGRTYVYRGLTDRAAFTFEADSTGAQLGGMFVSVVGDVDADGVPDVYASDWPNAAHGRSTGRIYVRSGADGHQLLVLTGEAAGDGFGIGPADAGDVNGDGHADIVVGAWRHGGAAAAGGKVYVYSGADGSLLRGITCRVMGDTFGFDATGMGDVDGDGVPDYLLTSAWSAVRGPRSGRMFLVSGK